MNKPAEKDYDVLEVGTDRDLVRAELGQPMASAAAGNCDIFSFEEGSGGLKYLRAAGYSLLAIGTLGISEMVTNPVEASVGNDKVRIRVCYDPQHNVNYSELLRVGKPAKLMSGSHPPAPVAKPVVAVAPPPAPAPPVVEPAPVPAPVAVEMPPTEPAPAAAATQDAEAVAAVQAVEQSLIEEPSSSTPAPTPPAEPAGPTP
ncbi:hypothetical protein D0B54_10010 [Solimonas sp. K1W22B-7]|nr:hypothetical protein D0B54_10010 [Solimonas sp. K1W22B-7]